MSSLPLILASQSPRRAALLKQMGFEFKIITEPVDESSVTIQAPVEHVTTLAKMKTEAVLSKVDTGIIIGADTIVCLDGDILGKPKTREHAVEMLSRLSGQRHEVYTGFCLVSTEGKVFCDFERTTVVFRPLSSWEIESYVDSGGAMDKAGGYGIQDASGLFVERIDGCFYNVVGFPLTRFYEGLKQMWDESAIAAVLRKECV